MQVKNCIRGPFSVNVNGFDNGITSAELDSLIKIFTNGAQKLQLLQQWLPNFCAHSNRFSETMEKGSESIRYCNSDILVRKKYSPLLVLLLNNCRNLLNTVESEL